MEQETKKCPYCGEEILAVAKKCKYCGEWLTEEKAEDNTKQMIPCPICSEMIEEGTEICPHCHEKLTKPCCPAPESPNPKKAERKDDGTRKFFDYYIVEPYLRNYAVFNARLNRKHYFVGLLVWAAIFFGLFLVFAAAMTDDTPAAYQILATGIFGIYTLGSIIPLYATATRRLRDADSAPNTIAWVLLVFASPLILFWICRRTEDEDIRVDGLEPDGPQLVEFGKTDGITSLVLTAAIILGLALNPGAWGDKVPAPVDNKVEKVTDDYNSIENDGTDEVESEDITSEEDDEDVWLGELLEEGNDNIEDPVWRKRLIRLVGEENYNFMREQYMGTAIQKEDGMMGRYQSYTFSGSTNENSEDGYVVSYSCGDGHENLEVEITRNGKAKTYQETN